MQQDRLNQFNAFKRKNIGLTPPISPKKIVREDSIIMD
jgi:hypothetical protein